MCRDDIGSSRIQDWPVLITNSMHVTCDHAISWSSSLRAPQMSQGALEWQGHACASFCNGDDMCSADVVLCTCRTSSSSTSHAWHQSPCSDLLGIIVIKRAFAVTQQTSLGHSQDPLLALQL